MSQNQLWPNKSDESALQSESFQDVRRAGGFALVHKGHGIALGDIDKDGGLDNFGKDGRRVSRRLRSKRALRKSWQRKTLHRTRMGEALKRIARRSRRASTYSRGD